MSTTSILPDSGLSLLDFPSSSDNETGINIYDDSSLENYMAVLSHYLQTADSNSCNHHKKKIINALIEYLRNKKDCTDRNWEELNQDAMWEECFREPKQNVLFADFFNVPFPNPKSYNYTFIDLFAGIGGIRLPFTEMGYGCVFSSEWDKHAQQTYLANFGEMPFGDICLESTKRFIPDSFDLLLAGFPCQAFSIIGKRKGFQDTRGTLFFEVASILDKHKPKAFLLENVKQLTTHDGGKTFATILSTLEELGYTFKWKVLNALDFGLPQKRERVIIVGFRDPRLTEEFSFDFEVRPYNLSDILEEDDKVDLSLFASETILAKRQQKTRDKRVFYPSVWHENKSGNISILDHACALRTGASYNYLLINGQRRPSSRELLRFQGFPEAYRVAVSHGEIRRQTGNTVAVPMIRDIALKIDKLFKKYYETSTAT